VGLGTTRDPVGIKRWLHASQDYQDFSRKDFFRPFHVSYKDEADLEKQRYRDKTHVGEGKVALTHTEETVDGDHVSDHL
jgi:hypothetical protein